MKVIRIFLGGSIVLLQGDGERRGYRPTVVDPLISSLNSRKTAKELYVVKTFADLEHEAKPGGQQRLFNHYLTQEADIAVFILENEIGPHTSEELELALKSRHRWGHPLVYIYGKDVDKESLLIKQLNHRNLYFEPFYDSLDLQKKIRHDLENHPRFRRRVLFLAALVACLAGILGFSILHSSVGGKTADLSGQVLIHARLLDSAFVRTDSAIAKVIDYESYMGIDKEYGLGPFYEVFHYIDTFINGVHAIRPFGQYVGDYYLHDSITVGDPGFLMLGEDDFTNIHYPILDVSLVNNSSQTILVDELLIEVEDSHADSNPFVIISETGGCLTLEDRGWNPWESASLSFTLLPEGQPFDGTYRFNVPILSTDIDPESPGIITIPLYDYFVKSGIDFDSISTCSIVYKQEGTDIPFWNSYTEDESALDSLRSILSPVKLKTELYDETDDNGDFVTNTHYEDPYLMLYGELTFDNGSTYKVGGHVRFMTDEGLGAVAAYCSRVFDVKLKTSGWNYRIKYPVSHYLRAGDVDRIAIQIDADRTSYHTLRVRLHNVNQIDIQTDPIDLLIFKYN